MSPGTSPVSIDATAIATTAIADRPCRFTLDDVLVAAMARPGFAWPSRTGEGLETLEGQPFQGVQLSDPLASA
jgi:hypothetical protein